jgi:hypothetical protein
MYTPFLSLIRATYPVYLILLDFNLLPLPELENLKLQPGFQKLSYNVVSVCLYVAGYGTKFHARKYQEHICRIQCA